MVEVPKEARTNMKFIFVKKTNDVLETALRD